VDYYNALILFYNCNASYATDIYSNIIISLLFRETFNYGRLHARYHAIDARGAKTQNPKFTLTPN